MENNYFAQVDTNNTVVEVIVISPDDCQNLQFPESEPIGQQFIASIGLAGNWLQTSPEGLFRAYYAGIGYTFDSTLGEYGEFVPYVNPNPDPIESV